MEIRISVLASGVVLLDGKAVQSSDIKIALEAADGKKDWVLYYRESAAGEPPAVAMEVIKLIVARKLPVSFSSRPDFSDYVDAYGQSHPRVSQGQPPSRDPLEPRMPDVDLRRKPEDVFSEAKRSAEGEKGPRGVAIVRPDRGVLVLPELPPSAQTRELAKQLPSMIPIDRKGSIAVIGNTVFSAPDPGAVPSIQEASRAIPFLGYLIGWCQAGHRVWVFEGHPSALAAGLADSDYLIVDSVLLPFLQPDWMQVARRAMNPGGKVFLHDREKYQLLPLAPSAEPPGWRLSEPDGEASYANCLLTTLAKGTAHSVAIVSGAPLPDLAGLTTDPKELEWIAGLPFRYDVLDADKVIAILVNAAAKGKADPSQNEWTLATKVVAKGAEPKLQAFVFRRERKLLKTVLHIGKRAT